MNYSTKLPLRWLLIIPLIALIGYALVWLLPVVWALWIKMGLEDPDPLEDCDGYMERDAPPPPDDEAWIDREFERLRRLLGNK